ncbi:MAG: lipid-A-disaccharide synthase [Proteobacteria bacterium]|nr:lipid-A-disaccharide synthase [Pseudomonadota bacterium]
MPVKIAISAGEVSGDEHAAKLARALQGLLPGAALRGMGGRHLRAAGVETVVDSEASASAMGFIEVLSQLGKIRSALARMKALLREWRPDILIVVDFPDFHFLLTKYAKKLGIKTLYFIIPKMWVWRTGRIQHFKRYIDHAACIFPFEKQFCHDHGYGAATYVGHPFAREFRELAPFDRRKFLEELELNPTRPVVALFPGSRKNELTRHLQPMLQGFALVASEIPGTQGILPLPSTIDPAMVQAAVPQNVSLKIIQGRSVEVLRAADVGLIKSGTSNLQASFCELPFVMLFNASKITELIVRTFVRSSHYSIVNLLRTGTVLELIQEEVNAERISFELKRLLRESSARERLREALREVNSMLLSHDQVPGCGEDASPYERTASLVQTLLRSTRSAPAEVANNLKEQG